MITVVPEFDQQLGYDAVLFVGIIQTLVRILKSDCVDQAYWFLCVAVQKYIYESMFLGTSLATCRHWEHIRITRKTSKYVTERTLPGTGPSEQEDLLPVIIPNILGHDFCECKLNLDGLDIADDCQLPRLLQDVICSPLMT